MKQPKPKILKLFNIILYLVKLPGIIITMLLFCIGVVFKFKFSFDEIFGYAMDAMMNQKSKENIKLGMILNISSIVGAVIFWGLITFKYFL